MCIYIYIYIYICIYVFTNHQYSVDSKCISKAI